MIVLLSVAPIHAEVEYGNVRERPRHSRGRPPASPRPAARAPARQLRRTCRVTGVHSSVALHPVYAHSVCSYYLTNHICYKIFAHWPQLHSNNTVFFSKNLWKTIFIVFAEVL